MLIQQCDRTAVDQIDVEAELGMTESRPLHQKER